MPRHWKLAEEARAFIIAFGDEIDRCRSPSVTDACRIRRHRPHPRMKWQYETKRDSARAAAAEAALGNNLISKAGGTSTLHEGDTA